MSRVNFKGLFLVVLALASFQLSSCIPADSSAGKTRREKKLTDENLPWLTEMDLPETKILQKRIFMSGKGRDAPEGRYAYIPERPGAESSPMTDEHLGESTEALNGFKDEIMDAPLAKILQKRIFMSGKGKTGRDAPEGRYAYIPEREGSEITNERASDLKKLLSLRDRVRDFHAKIDRSIDRYRSNDEKQENAMAGKELDDAQLRQWEKILNGFDTD